MAEALESHLLGQVERPGIGFWHQVRALAVLDRVPRDRAVEVVDIGAGAGLLGVILARERPLARYRFYEPIDSLAGVAEARFGPDSRMAVPEDCATADVVALLDVIEHVESETELLEPILSCARAGSEFVITVPALPVLWSSWDEQLGHYRRYTRRTLMRSLNTLALDLCEVSYLFPELVAPALVRRALRGAKTGAADTGGSDFPELPARIDRVLRSISTLTYRSRSWWPVGSSLLALGRRS